MARSPPRMENGFFVAQEITNREYDLRFVLGVQRVRDIARVEDRARGRRSTA